MAGGGYDIGASLSGSSSSGASLSGATESGGGGNYGGTNYGPGSLIQVSDRGSLGSSSNWAQILVIGGLVLAGVWIIKKFR
jgi:hypothetical protein